MTKNDIKKYDDRETECERAVRLTQALWKRLLDRIKKEKLEKVKSKEILTQE